MLILKVAPVFLLVLTATAEKKIELQDIEDDNLKSERQQKIEKEEGRASPGDESASGILYNFFKSHYFNPTQSQQPRFVTQYAVTEQPEQRDHAPSEAVSQTTSPIPKLAHPTQNQAMVGYLSNVPMQIYLVPQYYNEPSGQAATPQTSVKYSAPSGGQVAAYPTAPEAQQNYIEIPAYVTPSGTAYIPQYSPVSPSLAYVTLAHPTPAPAHSTVGPILYQMPLVHYPTAIAAPPVAQKTNHHYQLYSNTIDDSQDDLESPKQYVTQTEAPYTKPTGQEYPRYYNSRTPIREEHRHMPISELPPPNPILFKHPPSHLAHLPKALPIYRPLTKPVYAAGGNLLTQSYTPRPSELYAAPFRRRPNSLLDSYIPSNLQVEYLKRGYTKDPLQAYEALSSGHHFSTPSGPQRSSIYPKHYERGFLPNQMYHTAAGGITYGHYKRTPKTEKVTQKK